MPYGNIGTSAMDALKPQIGNGGAGPSGRVSGISPQQAVKILSLRIPERQSQGSIAPTPLLTSRGSAGAGSDLDPLIRNLIHLMQPQASLAPPKSGGGVTPPIPGAPGPGFAPSPGPRIDRSPFSGTQPVPGGGQLPRGTDSYAGWRDQERTLNRPGGAPGVPRIIPAMGGNGVTNNDPIHDPWDSPPPDLGWYDRDPGAQPFPPTSPMEPVEPPAPTEPLETAPTPPLWDESPAAQSWTPPYKRLFEDYQDL